MCKRVDGREMVIRKRHGSSLFTSFGVLAGDCSVHTFLHYLVPDLSDPKPIRLRLQDVPDGEVYRILGHTKHLWWVSFGTTWFYNSDNHAMQVAQSEPVTRLDIVELTGLTAELVEVE